jgi:hypothetical protein
MSNSSGLHRGTATDLLCCTVHDELRGVSGCLLCSCPTLRGERVVVQDESGRLDERLPPSWLGPRPHAPAVPRHAPSTPSHFVPAIRQCFSPRPLHCARPSAGPSRWVAGGCARLATVPTFPTCITGRWLARGEVVTASAAGQLANVDRGAASSS